MDTTYRDWESLPAELLHLILQLVATDQSKFEACNNALVCKAWKSTAQEVAYSDITIKADSQFKKFYIVIIKNPHLGDKVKTLNLLFDNHLFPEANEEEVSELLTSLLTTSLPNLQVLNKENLHTCVPTLNTLLDSNLKKLRRLQYPDGFMGKSEYDKYINCAFAIKDRLENLYIACSDPLDGGQLNKNLDLQYQHLYNSLYQYKNLVDITVFRNTDDGVQVLEYIVESCKTPVNQQNVTRPNIDISFATILKYIPRSNIKSLTFSAADCSKNDNILSQYIMHKFPRLQNLLFVLKAEDPILNVHLITQLLNYASKIENFSLSGLSINRGNIMEAIGKFWDRTGIPGSETLHINYSRNCPENIKASLEVTKEAGKGIHTTLKHPIHVDFEWSSYLELIENSGRFIAALCFIIEVDSNRFNRSILPDNFLLHTLTKCLNLQQLHLIGCVLRDNSHLETALEYRRSIDKLAFQNCRIQEGVLEQLSPLVFSINRLYLSSNLIYFSENVLYDDNTINSPQLMITMPYTIMNRIRLELEDYEETYVKLFVSTEKTFHYYKFIYNKTIKTSTKQEYEADKDEQHIYISCLNQPEFEIGMLELL